MKILYAEDEGGLFKPVKIFLTTEGFEVVRAYDGQGAIDAVKADPTGIELVLMDNRMTPLNGNSVWTGIDATRQIRANGYDKPILLFTGDSQPTVETRALEAGCNAVLAKPMYNGLLLEEIRRHVARSRGFHYPLDSHE